MTLHKGFYENYATSFYCISCAVYVIYINCKRAVYPSKFMIYADISFLQMQFTAHRVKVGLFGTSLYTPIRSRRFQ